MKTRNNKITIANKTYKEPIKVYIVVRPNSTNCDLLGNDPQKLPLNKLCKSSVLEGFRVHKKLKDCACQIGDVHKEIILEAIALGEIHSYKGKTYVHTVLPIKKISPFVSLRLVNDGIANTGRNNKGDYNSGDNNCGNHNSGDNNVGNNNLGCKNRGNFNIGYNNIGDKNDGWQNNGIGNSGSYNMGNGNKGDFNIGHHNTGNFNIGDFNCGHYNITSCSNGAFNTVIPKIYLFDKPSDWTLIDFENSDAYKVLEKLNAHMFTGHKYATFVTEEDMSDEDKQTYPEYLITGYCTKEKTYKSDKTPQAAWCDLEDNERQAVLSLPNFDADIFLKITGINVKSSSSPAVKKPKSNKSR